MLAHLKTPRNPKQSHQTIKTLQDPKSFIQKYKNFIREIHQHQRYHVATAQLAEVFFEIRHHDDDIIIIVLINSDQDCSKGRRWFAADTLAAPFNNFRQS